LRVRVKELGKEATFIRHEENKIKGKQKITDDPLSQEFWKLRSHRTNEVRNAARAAQLAYAFLRGKPYRSVERKSLTPDYLMFRIKDEVKRLVAKFGSPEFKSEVDKWFDSDTV
jgi:hypothetical protein